MEDNPYDAIIEYEQEWLKKLRNYIETNTPLPREYQIDYQIVHYLSRQFLGIEAQ